MNKTTLTSLVIAGLLLPMMSSAAAIYVEDFDPTVTDKYIWAETTDGSVVKYNTNFTNTNSSFTASQFDNGTFAVLQKAVTLTTDAFDVTGLSVSSLSVEIEAAAMATWRQDDVPVSFSLLDGSDDSVLATFDELAGGIGTSDTNLIAYNASPYAGSESSLNVTQTPQILTYNFSDYLVSLPASNSLKVRAIINGGTKNGKNDLALGSITVIPEPSSIALMGLSLLAVVAVARRRKS